MIVQTVLVGLSALIVWQIYVWITWYARLCKQLRKIPQKPGHWLFGNMADLKDARTYVSTIKSLVESESIRMFCIWVGPFPATVVTHPDTFKQLIPQVHDKARGFADPYRLLEPWIGDGLLLSYGKKWRRSRQLLTPAFHFEILKGYMSVMNDCSAHLCEKLKASKDGDSVEMFSYFGRSTLDVMMKCALSYTGSMQDDHASQYIEGIHEYSDNLFWRLLNPLLLSDFIFSLTPAGRRQKKIVKMFHEFTGTLIETRKQQLRTEGDTHDRKRHLDFLDILLTAKDDTGEGLSDQDIQTEVDTFLFEGHDTTTSALSWAAYCLGKYPDMQEKAYQEVSKVIGDERDFSTDHLRKLPYLTQFIREVLRFYHPVPIIARRHNSPIVLDGIEIPVGCRVDVNIAALHHHPAVWKDHMEFRPERFDSDHRDENELFGFIPFSAGSRNCIGQVFAMNELKITLGKLLKSFTISLDRTKPTEVDPAIVTRATNGIWLQLKERTT